MSQHFNEADGVHRFMYERIEALQKRVDILEDLGYELNIWLDWFVYALTVKPDGEYAEDDEVTPPTVKGRQAVNAWDDYVEDGIEPQQEG